MRRILPILTVALIAASAALAQTPAPRPPAGVVNLVRANRPGSASGGYFVETGSIRGSGNSAEIWIVNIFPADVVEGGQALSGYWRRLRFDCKARTMADAGTAMVDAKGAAAATVVDPAAAATPVAPGTTSDVAFKAACEGLRVPGEHFTNFFTALTAARTATP